MVKLDGDLQTCQTNEEYYLVKKAVFSMQELRNVKNIF